MNGYFDPLYFDPLYFDTGSSASTGGGAGTRGFVRGRRRRVPDDPEADYAFIIALTL